MGRCIVLHAQLPRLFLRALLTQIKIKLHLVSSYINLIAACSYYLLWTGFSPILPGLGSCL